MKIVCVGYLQGAGGAERQIIMLANALAERHHDVHLVVLAENKSKYSIAENVIVHDLTNAEDSNKKRIVDILVAVCIYVCNDEKINYRTHHIF